MAECSKQAGWFTTGTHGCEGGQRYGLGLHVHDCALGRHYWCSYCGARWAVPRA